MTDFSFETLPTFERALKDTKEEENELSEEDFFALFPVVVEGRVKRASEVVRAI